MRIEVPLTDVPPGQVTFITERNDTAPTAKSPISAGKFISPPTWRDPGPRYRWFQKPGGHTYKVADSFSGHAGHHHGNPALRWHERTEPDWDAIMETDLPDDVPIVVENATDPAGVDPSAEDPIAKDPITRGTDSSGVPTYKAVI